MRRYEGLICFVRDFYRSIAYKVDEWSDELLDITINIRDEMLMIIDKLDRLSQSYSHDVKNNDYVLFSLDSAVLSIPDLSRRQRRGMISHNDLITMANDDRMEDEEEELFGQDVEDRILRICRDNIISTNLTIRAIFKIDSSASDVLINPYFIKKRLKDVCGLDATFKEISWFVDKSMKRMLKKL